MAKVKDNEELPERYTRKFGDSDDDHDDLDGELDEITVRPTAEQRDLAMLMDEIGASPKATVTIYRVTASKGKGAYIMQYPLSSKTLQEVMDYLRDVKKGGEFRFYVHDGQNMRANQPVTVEPPTPEEIREYEAKVKSANPYAQNPAPQPAQNDAVMLLLQKMQDDQERREQQYREEQKRRDEQVAEERRREEARHDRDLERVREDKKFMLTLLTNNKPEKSSLSELLEGMVAMQALNGGGQKKESELDILIKGLALRDQLIGDAPGGKEDSVVNTAIKHLGAPLMGVIAAMNKPVPAQNPVPRQRQTPKREPEAEALPAPTVQPDPVTQPATQNPEEKIAMLFAEIVEAAKKNADPAPYSDLLIETFGEDMCASTVDDDQSFEALMEQLKPVGAMLGLGEVTVTHREWFDRLREIMLDSLFIDDDESADDEQSDTISDESGA